MKKLPLCAACDNTAVGAFKEAYNKGRIHTSVYFEIVTREFHTRKKYSLIGINNEGQPMHRLCPVGTELRDSHGTMWKVIDYYDGKLVLRSKDSKKHPVGKYLRDIREDE